MSADNTMIDKPSCEDEQPGYSSQQRQKSAEALREHEPLTDILSLIPHKVKFSSVRCQPMIFLKCVINTEKELSSLDFILPVHSSHSTWVKVSPNPGVARFHIELHRI